jgi:hypothetical protein
LQSQLPREPALVSPATYPWSSSLGVHFEKFAHANSPRHLPLKAGRRSRRVSTSEPSQGGGRPPRPGFANWQARRPTRPQSNDRAPSQQIDADSPPKDDEPRCPRVAAFPAHYLYSHHVQDGLLHLKQAVRHLLAAESFLNRRPTAFNKGKSWALLVYLEEDIRQAGSTRGSSRQEQAVPLGSLRVSWRRYRRD